LGRDGSRDLKLVATCARGTEGAVRGELAALGMRHLRGSRGAVTFEGRMEDGMRACLWSRTAMRVLAPLASFPCPDATALYDGVRTVDWTEWLNVKTTLAVDATGTAPGLHHTGFVALKVKDGVVDSLRDALGGRPDVDTRDPDVRIVLHLARGQAELSLDLSGAPLYRRGWRNTVTEAPLKETLAASILALGEAALDGPFLDPLCGSGTLAIEHALAARRIAPGLGRPFGFQRWPRYRGEWQSSWDRMKEEARAAVLPRAPAAIRASDRDEEALDAARRNARAAGVEADVEVLLAEARTVEPFGDAGTICTNPPYGERIGGQPLQLAGFYRGLAEAFRRFHGWRVLVLSGNPLLERNLGMRPEWTHRLWNGPLEVNLVRCRVP
jgi:putative N6-adenine-specific DNA methylase